MKTTVALTAALVTLLFVSSAGAAALRLTPAKARPGALVTAVGSGFPHSRAGTITVGGHTVAFVRTGSGGSFTKRFRAPGLRRGQKIVVARVFGQRVVSALIIGRRTISSSMTAVSTGQRVYVSPTVGPSGTGLVVRGARFPAGGTVSLLYSGSLRAEPVVGAGGTFAKRLVVPATRAGANRLTVRWGGGAMAIPFAAQSCGVQVCLPYNADYTLNHGGKTDKNGLGTGFTMVAPRSAGGGYIPANLEMNRADPGTLAVTATPGIAVGTHNQDNMLGVGVPTGSSLAVSTVLLNIPAGTHANEQAGIWFGKNQSTYAKLIEWSPSNCATPPCKEKIELLWDVGGNNGGTSAFGNFSGKTVALKLVVNPAAKTITGFYSVDGGAVAPVDGTQTAPASLFTPGPVYAGIFASSRTRDPGLGPLVYTFDSFSVARTTVGPGPGPGTDGTWATKASMPQAVLDAGSAELGGKLYMVGGKIAGSPSSVHISKLYIYNQASDSWTTGADLPYGAVENPAVVAYNGKLYAFGGGTSAFKGAVDSAAVYDPGTDSWSSLASMHYVSTTGVDTPVRRSGAVAEVIGDKIYIAGGLSEGSATTNGMAQRTVLVYDPATDTWARKKDLQVTRDNPGAASIGGFLYVFGGRVNNAQLNVTTVERYDPSTNTWAYVAPMPTGRRSMVVSILNGKVVVMGGEGGSGATGFVTGANEEYDPVANTWRSLKAMPTPRHGTGAGSIGGTIYVAGGSPKAGTGFTAINEAFTLP